MLSRIYAKIKSSRIKSVLQYYSTFYYRGNAKPGETILLHGATGSVSLHLSAMHSYKEKPCAFDYFRVPVSESISTNKTSISVLSQTCSKEQCRTNQTFIFGCPSSVHAYTVCFSVCTPQGIVIHVNLDTKKEVLIHISISQISVIKLFQDIALVNYSVSETALLILQHWYWWTPNYQKNSIIWYRLISHTLQLTDWKQKR